jgi:hypothetical protein
MPNPINITPMAPTTIPGVTNTSIMMRISPIIKNAAINDKDIL